MKQTFLIITLIVQLTFPALSQQPAKPTTGVTRQDSTQDDVVRITTNLVQVDPVITDHTGKQVTDLRPDEIQIFEDGKQQQISNFSYVSLASGRPSVSGQPVTRNAPPIPPVPLKPERVRRTIALLVDDLGLSFESAYHVRQALKKFVEKQMQPDDLVAIIRTGGGIGALQQFTSDKRQLLAAVEKVKWNMLGRGGVSAIAPIRGNDLLANSTERGLAANRDSSEELDRFREELFTVGTLGALNYVVKGLRELPGRKSIVLMSDGISILNRNEPGGSARILEGLRRLSDLANRASVVIYTMDARGLQTLGFTAADSSAGMTPAQFEESMRDRREGFFESQNGLNYLAHQTGGLFIHNNNDLSDGIRRVIQDQEGYYLIGYRPEESTFDTDSGRRKFHKLSLKVTRPGRFNIRMRSGFYGITDEDAVDTTRTHVQRMVSAISSPFGSAGVNIRLTSLFANDSTAGSIVRSMVHVQASDLTFTPEADGWHKAVFDILAVTFGDNGVVVEQEARTHTIRVRGEVHRRILKDGFTYNVTVPIKKTGAYQFRLALRDVPSDRIGSAGQFIEVPDLRKNRLTLSGIVMRGVPLETYQKQGLQIINGNQSGKESSLTDAMAGPAVRQFKSGMVMIYGFMIYNAQIDKATNQPQLHTQIRLFRNGELVFSGKELPLDTTGQLDLKRLTGAGALNLGTELSPGEYAFQIVVTDLKAKEKHRVATQWIDFEIVK
ncbi:MAG TPA: VWA domain-containing protein [Pyrinomonadaceae bacterium]